MVVGHVERSCIISQRWYGNHVWPTPGSGGGGLRSFADCISIDSQNETVLIPRTVIDVCEHKFNTHTPASQLVAIYGSSQ